jgi:DNA-binding response OmpR family regulator
MLDKQSLPKILLIENDIPTIALYKRELANNYQVFSCYEENSVLKYLEDENIVAIILEPAFLGDDGWNLLIKIKDATSSTPVPIVVCTTQDACLRATKFGAAKCLVKPVLPSTLLQILEDLIYMNQE